MDFATFLSSYRRTLALSLDAFWRGVVPFVPPDERYSIMTINRWEHGEAVAPISWLKFLRDAAPAESWQKDFAQRGFDLRMTECNSNGEYN